LFVDLEAAQLEVLDHLPREGGELVVGRVQLQDSAHQLALAADRKAYRREQLISERAPIHRRRVLMMFS
jgi:hypothetical protein